MDQYEFEVSLIYIDPEEPGLNSETCLRFKIERAQRSKKTYLGPSVIKNSDTDQLKFMAAAYQECFQPQGKSSKPWQLKDL